MRRFFVMALILVCSRAYGDDLEIHFVDVGQGDCTIIACPNGKKILVDCGSGFGCSNIQVRDYVQRILGGNLSALVITHPDTDHYGLLPEILANLKPAHLFRPAGTRTDYGECGMEGWLETVEGGTETSVHELDKDFHDAPTVPNAVLDCGDAEIFVLAANVQASTSPSNARSIVLLLSHGEFDAVLTGDATADTEAKILERYDSA